MAEQRNSRTSRPSPIDVVEPPSRSTTRSRVEPRPTTKNGSRQPELSPFQQDIATRIGETATVDFVAMAAVSSLHRVAAIVRNHMERTVLAPDGLSWSAFSALLVLWVRGDQEARHLAQQCGVSKGTLTGIVSTLEGRGLVLRNAHPSDGRLVVMSLTTKGRSTVKRLFPKFNRQEAEAAAGLSNAEQQTLAALLSKLEQHVAV